MKIELPGELARILNDIDGRGYKAYKALQGKSFEFSLFHVRFEHVQGDPFALPTRLSVTVDPDAAGFDTELYDTPTRRLALEDFLLRAVLEKIGQNKIRIRGTGKSGEVSVLKPGQKILKRSAMLVQGNKIQLILFAGLPADGRTILGKECLKLFAEVLLSIWSGSLLASSLDVSRIKQWLETLEDHKALQDELEKNGWTAFVADGSLLPRESGISDRPLNKKGVKIVAPATFSEEMTLPHRGRVRGMAVPRGITLIVGGGFHGKSTLLRALQDGVYPHIPGDGREAIATMRSAVKVRAEDGRSVKNVDVSGFMDRLPLVESTRSFFTQAASGSTSQAVNILEAIEAGSGLLLMDEDTCATNFMIRDARMQALIESDMEPITPFLDRVEEIHDVLGANVILVMGGSGDYFDCAHHVIAMKEFIPQCVTGEAKAIIEKNPGERKKETSFPFPKVQERCVELKGLSFNRGKKECVIQTRGTDTLVLGRTDVDTRYLEQLVEEGQLELCGWILNRLKSDMKENAESSISRLKTLFATLEENGLDTFNPFNNGLLVLPRIQEAMAVLNRIR